MALDNSENPHEMVKPLCHLLMKESRIFNLANVSLNDVREIKIIAKISESTLFVVDSYIKFHKSKKEGKYQEWIQSRNTPYPGHHVGK